ncbi:tyrosine-type recombinase/integrase [Candidatus Rariloculus sp.]|uniref:tyrosine-type recombinase/integrase n=1 Tax=Candidatus Rariloculus sp. TaxID=3101265 RepID=UPI003D145E7E
MANPATLTARFCETVTTAGRYGDGRGGYGLALNVKPMSNGRTSKSWTQRLVIGGKPTNIGLGRFPLVSLAAARKRAVENATIVHKGHDPRDGGVPTFRSAMETVLKLDAKRWRGGEHGRSAEQWRESLSKYALPIIGSKRIDKITSNDVIAIVGPIWHTTPTTAKRVRQRIGRIMAWAVGKNYIAENTATKDVTGALGKPDAKTKHFAWVPFKQVSNALFLIRNSKAEQAVKLAFELLILTAARSQEIREMTWAEVDLDEKVWTISSDRMKKGETHRQPLSTRSIEVLREARSLTNGTGLVFPRANGATIKDDMFPRLAKALELNGTPHGMRTSWRVWASECSSISEAGIERQLSHKVPNEAQAAYDQSDRFDERRECMQQWSEYVTPTADIVRLHA